MGTATLTRFYAGHFLLPFLMVGLVIIHLVFLHEEGSSNPLGITPRLIFVSFHPSYTVKDIVGFVAVALALRVLVGVGPNYLGDPENFILANPLVTPTHIKPEWYFLWVYAILRSIPSKLGGVVIIVMAVGSLALLPLFRRRYIGVRHRLGGQLLFWSLVAVVLGLTWVGAQPIEPLIVNMGITLTVGYFVLLFRLVLF